MKLFRAVARGLLAFALALRDVLYGPDSHARNRYRGNP